MPDGAHGVLYQTMTVMRCNMLVAAELIMYLENKKIKGGLVRDEVSSATTSKVQLPTILPPLAPSPWNFPTPPPQDLIRKTYIFP